MARDGNPVLHVDTSSPLRIRAFVAHPIAAFLTMVFSIAYPVMTLPILAIHGVIPRRRVTAATARRARRSACADIQYHGGVADQLL